MQPVNIRFCHSLTEITTKFVVIFASDGKIGIIIIIIITTNVACRKSKLQEPVTKYIFRLDA